APKVAAAPAPTAAPTPEPAPMSADDGDEDGSSMGGPKRLLGQLDEVLQRHLPGWSRIRDRARRNRS
ncbi:MAG: hypothetical protein P8R54_16375, partial [Myxococcota bacterium]|nr:hypothetical protein [Myxococcota bacterium]